MKTSLSKYKNNIFLNYIYVIFISLDLSHGIWMIFLAEKGITLTQLGILEGVFHITSFLMETPTGVIADLFGRKISRLTGLIMNIIFMILLLIGNNIFIFLIAFIFSALSYNLESGAGDALVYESLLKLKASDKFTKVGGINEFFMQFTKAISLILGGIIAVFNYNLVFQICIVISLSNFFIGSFFKETLEEKNNIRKCNLVDSLKNQYIISFRIIKNYKNLLFLIIYLNIIECFITCTFFYSQNYWKNYGFDESTIGVLLALHCVFGAFGGIIAHRIDNKFELKNIIKTIPILICFSFWFHIFINLSLISIIILGFLESIIYVIISVYINKAAPNKQRATIISFSSTIFSSVMIIIFPLLGLIGDKFSLKISFLVIAFISTLFSFFILKKDFEEVC